jgi:GNAT superfamily N-acetyltransferase
MENEHGPHALADGGLGIAIVAADHPSVHSELERYFGELRAERRFFGPSASANPKPFPSLIEALAERSGFRLVAFEHGRVIGAARVDPHGRLFLAVVPDRRGTGIGTLLGRAALERASALGFRRIVLRTTRRSRAARRVGEQLGCVVVELAHGRTDMILDPASVSTGRRSA